MDKKEEFKLFVKKNPKLINYIKDGSMNFQKFYEIYDMYGESSEAWKPYLEEAVTTTLGVNQVFNFFKGIDLDSFQNGINNLQRVIGVFQDLGNNSSKKEEYRPRPVYKHFED